MGTSIAVGRPSMVISSTARFVARVTRSVLKVKSSASGLSMWPGPAHHVAVGGGGNLPAFGQIPVQREVRLAFVDVGDADGQACRLAVADQGLRGSVVDLHAEKIEVETGPVEAVPDRASLIGSLGIPQLGITEVGRLRAAEMLRLVLGQDAAANANGAVGQVIHGLRKLGAEVAELAQVQADGLDAAPDRIDPFLRHPLSRRG